MGNRIKRVFSTADQVLHIWANQTQSDARSSNVFFDGKSCFSYGRHYELGRLTKYKGIPVALINATGYSVTTSKHISMARSAVSHLIHLDVDGSFNVKDALKTQQAEFKAEYEAHFRKRSFWQGSQWADSWLANSISEFNSTCKQLKESRFQVKITLKMVTAYNAHIQACLKRQAELKSPEALALKAKRAEKRAALNLLKVDKEIQAWRNGGTCTDAVRSLAPQILRIKGNEVETSRGARVPLDAARALLSQILEKPNAADGLIMGAASIGGYQLRDYDHERDIIQIGCHSIALVEAVTVLAEQQKAA